MIEIESMEAWQSRSQSPVAVQQIDLRAETEAILAGTWEDSLFLGCQLETEAAVRIVETGGLVLPHLEDFEFAVHCAGLYRVEDLYQDFDADDPASYLQTPDARIYQQYCDQGKIEPSSIRVSLARRLHDHSMSDALMEALEGKAVVAVMGGHALERRDPVYAEVAALSRTLARDGFFMITGGGPGAMEACHLGVYLAHLDDEALNEALALLAPRPPDAKAGKEYADKDWLQRAWRVRRRFPVCDEQFESIGIPTWMYGHEPPAVFATRHAKYFANSVREDGLLMWANHGVVFSPGSAGTIQEIFQDSCQNHYEVTGTSSPMILYGSEHWTKTKPVWPLLETVSTGKAYGDWLRLTDDPSDVVEVLRAYRESRQT